MRLKPVDLTAACAAVVFVGLVARSAWLSDDCLITWRTVLNLFDGYGLRWNISERVQGYTHPLWMLCLVAIRGLGAPVHVGTLGLSVALVAGAALALLRAPERRLSGAVVLLLLSASRGVVDFATSGLEGPLTYLLLVLLVLGLDRERPLGVLPLMLLSSALALNRLDLGALVGPVVLLSLWRQRAWTQPRALALGVLPLVLWFGFALLYYGSLLPNTAAAKLHHAYPTGQMVALGWTYLRASCAFDVLAGPLLGLGVLAGALSASSHHRALALGVVLSVAYTVWIGGDFMLVRFLTPALLVSGLLIERSLRGRPRLALAAMPLAALSLLASPDTPLRTPLSLSDHELTDEQLADERAYYFAWSGWFGPRNQGPVVPPRSREAGARRVVRHWGGVLVKAPAGEYSIDALGLTDPFLARLNPFVVERPRAGHFERGLPAGYVEARQTGRNLLVYDECARLYDDVVLATEAPLFARGRAGAIWRLHFGPTPQESGGGPPVERPDAAPWPDAPEAHAPAE